MHNHNPYAKPVFVPMSKGKDIFSKMKLYDLKWRGQIIISGQAWPVCKAKENQLVEAGTHGRSHFTITKHL